MLISLSEQVPELGHQFNGLICEFRMHVVFAVGDVPSQEVLLQDLLRLEVGLLIDAVLLEDDLIAFGLLLARMNDVVVVLVETVERLVHLGSQSMVTADSIGDLLVFLGTLLVEDDEDQIESRQQ